MPVFSVCSNKKIHVGYHWVNEHNKTGGIARYIENITKSFRGSDIEFTNFSTQRNYSMSFFGRFFFMLEMFFFSGNIRKQKIDIYWGPAHKLPLFRVRGVSYILTVHDLVWKICPRSMPLRRRLAERIFFPISIRNADTILAVSQSTANDIVQYFPSCAHKVKVIPLAGMIENYEESIATPKRNQKYILFVGTIEPRKNINYMLQAYAGISKDLKEKYKFFLVGNVGWGDIDLNAMIVNLGLSQYVEWKTATNDQDLLTLYENAYCLLFPSLYEGFGLPILEAHNFGVPVITSNLSSMPEVVGNGGLLVDPHSVESIRSAVESVLENVGLREALSENAKVNSGRFSWDETIKLTGHAFVEAMDLRNI